jgi:hypothetical protein
MKGISLIQDTFLLICEIALVVITAVFVWVLILTFQVEDRILPGGVPTTRSVEMNTFIKPASYESMMSAFLESQYLGISIKEIVNAQAIQMNAAGTVWLDGKTIDLASIAHDYWDTKLGRYYILKVGNTIIAEKGTLTSSSSPTALQKVSVRLFLLDGSESYLQLFVAG